MLEIQELQRNMTPDKKITIVEEAKKENYNSNIEITKRSERMTT